MREEYVEAVQAVVAMIPSGTVLAYGDVALLLESGGPRQVGAVMSRGARGLPWWRVLRASGEPPQGHELSAFEHYRSENTPLRGEVESFARAGEGAWRVHISQARWQPTEQEFLALDELAQALRPAPGGTSGIHDRQSLSPRRARS